MDQQTSATWTPLQKFLFRFGFCYFLFSYLPFPIDGIPYVGEWFAEGLNFIWDPLVRFVGRNVLGVADELSANPTGSGDRMYDWATLSTNLLMATLIAGLWSLLDRRRTHYARLDAFLMVFLRYYLAVTLLGYGFAKVYHNQMSSPSLGRLIQPYGESSPMGLLWTFVGYSKYYSAYVGWSEVIPGLLLFFRRTTLAGALMAAVVMLNVAVLNFCFDVPVKIYSTLLFVTALYIASPYFKHLYAFFIRHSAVPAFSLPPLFTEKKPRIAALVIKVLFIANQLYENTSYYFTAETVQNAPLKGVYDAESFSRNGQLAPPLRTDSLYWQKLMIARAGFASIRMANDSLTRCFFKVDTTQRTILAWPRADTTQKYTLRYELPDPAHLIVQGVWKKDSIRVQFKRFGENDFLLMNRGFHWVSETPFNR